MDIDTFCILPTDILEWALLHGAVVGREYQAGGICPELREKSRDASRILLRRRDLCEDAAAPGGIDRRVLRADFSHGACNGDNIIYFIYSIWMPFALTSPVLKCQLYRDSLGQGGRIWF